MLSKALATGSDTVRSPKGLGGKDTAGVDAADGVATGAASDRDLLRRRRRGGRSVVVGADELDPLVEVGGAPRVTVAVVPWGSEDVWPGAAKA